jgi:hypothetical protein
MSELRKSAAGCGTLNGFPPLPLRAPRPAGATNYARVRLTVNRIVNHSLIRAACPASGSPAKMRA